MEENQLLMDVNNVRSLLKKENLEKNDSTMWAEAFSQLKKMTYSILEGNTKQLNEAKWILQVFANIAHDIDGCLLAAKEKEGGSKCPIPDCFVHMLNISLQCFRYCQFAGSIYTDDLEISENLASLFKCCYQNIKVIMDLIETYSNQLFHDAIEFLLDVVICLNECSQVLADIDIMASVAVWKSVKCLFTAHKEEILMNHCRFTPLFNVCDIACKTLKSCFRLTEKDVDMINKYQKVIRFFLGIVLLITKYFKQLMTLEGCSQVYNLIHLIQKLLSIETRNDSEDIGCSVVYDSLNNTLLCGKDSLMNDFIEMKYSAPCVLGIICKDKKYNKNENVTYLMDLLNVLEYLSEKSEFIYPWMESSEECPDVVDALFSYVEHCPSCLFEKRRNYVVMDKSKCFKEVTLYEIVLVKLCTFASTLPSKYFEHLEGVMLSNVLMGPKYCALLATDIWCFISRWGKADLCVSHFIYISKVLIHMYQSGNTNVSIKNVSHLLRRLFLFLEDYQHKQILESFPINSRNIVIWKLLLWSHLNIPNKLDVCSEVVKTVLSLMKLKQKNENDDYLIVNGIECLNSLLSDQALDVSIPANLKQQIIECVIEFWSCFHDVDEDIVISEPLVIAILQLTSKLLSSFDGKFVYAVLFVISDILRNTENQSFHIQCTYFLTQLKNITFPAEEESNCLQIISEMFQYLMIDQDWMTDDCIMKALQTFAEETLYSCVLVTFLPPSRKKDFSIYLKREVCRDDLSIGNVLEIIYQQPSNNNDIGTMEEKMTISEDKQAQISNVIDKIERDVREFDELVWGDSLSPGLVLRVKAIKSILDKSCK